MAPSGDDEAVYDDGARPARRKSKPRASGEDLPAALQPTIENCPIKPLGKRDDRFAFMTPSADVREYRPNQISSPAFLAALFDGRTKWLRDCFPNVEKPGAYVAQSAASWLIQRCVERGFFDPNFDLRGPGAWRLDDDRLLLHFGDAVEIRNERGARERHDPGFEHGGRIYYAAPCEPLPADEPATPTEVCDFFDFLHRWRYGHVEDPRVLLGWIGCAYLAGALKWRPHIWVSGDSSMGKSTLESLVRALLGRAALSVADSTKAYIAQRLKSAARPVLLDEFERDVDPSRQKAIVELATLASREGQAGLGRGSPDGSTRDYMIRACFYFSSIVRAPLRAQERSRIHVVDLQPLGSASVADIRAVNAGVEKFGQGFPARLRARAHAGFWRFQANERVFAEAIQEVWLRGGRIADQMGTLLSMSHMMLSDRPVTLDQAKGLLGNFEGVKDDLVGRPDESEAQHCIAHLLSTTLTLEIEPRRQTKTISEIVNDVRRLQAVDGAIFQGSLHAELKRRGIAIVASESNGEQTLVVGNNHRSLHALYDGTRWNGGAWAHILRRLPGASATKNAVRFAGFQERGTLIPLSALPLVTIDDYSRDGEGVTPAVTPQTPENTGQTEAVTV